MVIGVAAVAAGLPEAVSALRAVVLGLPEVVFEEAEVLQAGGLAVVVVVAAQEVVVAVSIPARFSAASMPMATA
jgi:hypothetical protein